MDCTKSAVGIDTAESIETPIVNHLWKEVRNHNDIRERSFV